MHTKTELHTHLIGMLSAEKFIKFLIDFGYEFPINQYGEIDFYSGKINRISVEDALRNTSLLEKLYISRGDQIDYEQLNDMYLIRNKILADLIDLLYKKQTDFKDIDEAKYFIYGKYMNESLKELIAQEVEYVEISFSNAKIIENALTYIEPSVLEKIKFKFLLSTDRSKIAKDFRQSSNYMASLVAKNIAVGFDVMGIELPLSDLDMDRTSKFGMEQKLIPVIEKLNKLENTTLRIHSGETRYSSDNTYKVLSIIERISDDLKIKIPPPQIRIGHGIHFRKNQSYIDLLKKFGCIVEINATSNYALDNINDFKDIPYDYYLDNDIPLVICSDGHGLYDTSKDIEDSIAQLNVKQKNIEKILKMDKKIIKEK